MKSMSKVIKKKKIIFLLFKKSPILFFKKRPFTFPWKFFKKKKKDFDIPLTKPLHTLNKKLKLIITSVKIL